MLQDKILEYIRLYGIKQSLGSDTNFKSKMQEDMAKDIAEICIQTYFTENVKLGKENAELKAKISSYKVMQARWERVAELFGDKIHWGESKSSKVFDLVKELQEQLEQCKEHYGALQHSNTALYKQLADTQASLDSEIKSWKIINDYGIQLEKQLAAIKYLDEDEVGKILHQNLNNYPTGYDGIREDKINLNINAICSLAIKPIDKDRIIEVLRERSSEIYNDLELGDNSEKTFEQIANEILEVK